MVRILVASRRPWLSEALATSSYGTYLPQPFAADTLVSAAVVVVLPWSTWPIVPTFTWGLVRSNFSFAIDLSDLASFPRTRESIFESGAHNPNRTGDLTLTKGVLYRLSYVGLHNITARQT